MFRKRCDKCSRIGWFWERGWHYESQEEANQRGKKRAESYGGMSKTMREAFAIVDRYARIFGETRNRYCRACVTKERESRQATACGKCGKPLKRRGGSKPLWFDADQVDWHCGVCVAAFCGKCATSEPADLQK